MTQATKRGAPHKAVKRLEVKSADPKRRATKRLKASERRALIIEAAQAILLAEGLSALTLRNVAEAAGIRMATLQYYFPSREQLFQHAFQETVDAVWTQAINQLDSTPASNTEERLIGFLRSMCETSRNEPMIGCFIELWAAARVHDYAADIMRTYYDDAVALLAQLIQEARPVHGAKQSHQLAVLIMSMIEGLSLFNQIDSQSNRRPRIAPVKMQESIMVLLNAGRG